MLTNKNELEKSVHAKIKKIIMEREMCAEVCNYIKDTYNIPRGISSNYLSLRNPLSEADDFMLFALLSGIESVNKTPSTLHMFFTEKEIELYTNTKLEDKGIKFPLRFKMVPVSDDQWIGATSIKQMMELRRAQLINYNEDTQRGQKRIEKNGRSFFEINVSDTAVNAIKEAYTEHTYIPTAYTLNISDKSNADFYYDEVRHELVFRHIDHFDINDGYHRYLAGCHASDLNPKFDYPMELRIVNFSKEKSQLFIHQEDQKTKLKKMDSASFDTTKSANKLITRLNDDSSFYLAGYINRTDGVINFSELMASVDYLWFKKVTKKEELQLSLDLKPILIKSFNALIEYNKSYMKPYSFNKLIAVVYLIYKYNGDMTKILPIVDKVVARVEKERILTIANATAFNKVEDAIKTVTKEV